MKDSVIKCKYCGEKHPKAISFCPNKGKPLYSNTKKYAVIFIIFALMLIVVILLKLQLLMGGICPAVGSDGKEFRILGAKLLKKNALVYYQIEPEESEVFSILTTNSDPIDVLLIKDASIVDQDSQVECKNGKIFYKASNNSGSRDIIVFNIFNKTTKKKIMEKLIIEIK